MNKEQKNVTRLDVLDAIPDTDGRDLLYSIESDGISTRDLNLKMSRKQYYNRLSRLIKAHIIKRKSGKYLLTPFGKVIYGVTTRTCQGGRRAFQIKSYTAATI
jgi:hypothetical protein